MGVRTGGCGESLELGRCGCHPSGLLTPSSKGAPSLPSTLRHCALAWVYCRVQLYLRHPRLPPPHTPASPGVKG